MWLISEIVKVNISWFGPPSSVLWADNGSVTTLNTWSDCLPNQTVYQTARLQTHPYAIFTHPCAIFNMCRPIFNICNITHDTRGANRQYLLSVFQKGTFSPVVFHWFPRGRQTQKRVVVFDRDSDWSAAGVYSPLRHRRRLGRASSLKGISSLSYMRSLLLTRMNDSLRDCWSCWFAGEKYKI